MSSPVFLVAVVQWEETMVEGFQGKMSFLYVRISLTLFYIRASIGSLLKCCFLVLMPQNCCSVKSGVGALLQHHPK